MDKIEKAGDVNVNRIEIISAAGVAFNITNQVVQVNIFEDLFSPFLSGNVVVLDSVDIASALPLVGEERLNVDIVTPGSKAAIKGQFYLYKMSDKDRFNENSSAYVLHFMALEAVVDANRKLSKTFSGKTSDIVEQLIRAEGLNSKKTANLEVTGSSDKFISNFWSPTQCIAKTLDDAYNKNGSPSYVFFENREGFVYASLETLYKVEPMMKFVHDSYSRTLTNSGSTRDVAMDYMRISNLYVPEFFNYLDRLQGGFYSSALTSYDITTKKYTFQVYDANTKTTQTLNDKALVGMGANYRADALRLYVPKYYGNFNGYTDVTDAKTIQRRISLLKQADALKIRITVAGHTSYTVGRTADVEIYKDRPVRENDKGTDVIDKAMSGRYLVSAISHSITHKEHICNIELIKDSILKAK